MSKKDKRSSKKGDEDIKRDQKLQAILLADTFRGTFNPITWDMPTVLLPLINIPMLEYTVEFLAQNGVEEIFIFCVWDAETIQAYVKASKWSSLLSVRCIVSTSCLSAGDALREMDALGEVRSDPFILISGDVVANLDLKKAIQVHKDRCNADPECVMTCCMKKMSSQSKVRPVRDDLVVAMDKNTSQLLLFNDQIGKSSVTIPVEIMLEHPQVEIHTDLLDCHVDICSPAFLMQFSDNFDYQDIRKHFIQNEAINWELGMHLYGHILENHEYAARVSDPRTYHAVCLDLVNRWVYPIVPEYQFGGTASNDVSTVTNYTHQKYNIYKAKSAKVSRNVRLTNSVVIGNDSVVKDGVCIARSILGAKCVINENVTVLNSHLWGDNIIEQGVAIKDSIIANGVTIRAGATISRGCMLAHGVVIDRDCVLPPYTRVMSMPQWDSLRDEDDNDYTQAPAGYNSDVPYDTDILGPNGVGYVWAYRDNEIFFFDDVDGEEESDSDEEEEEIQTWGNTRKTGRTVLNAVHSCSIGCTEEELFRRTKWGAMINPTADDEMYCEDDDEDSGSDASGFEDYSLDVHDISSSGAGLDSSTAVNITVNTATAEEPDEVSIGTNDSVSVRPSTASPPPARSSSVSPKPASASKNASANTSFYAVIHDMVLMGYANNQQAENVLLEIKGFKFAQNKEFLDCIQAVIPALFDSIAPGPNDPSVDVSKLIGAVKKICIGSNNNGWGYKLLKALCQGPEDELAMIEAIEDYSCREACAQTFYAIFRFIMQLFYDAELLSEEVLLQWIDLRRNHCNSSSRQNALFNETTVQDFVDWIEAEEEDDSEEEDEDEDE